MTFDRIQGNEDVKRSLAGMVDSGKVPHAIMFHEDDGGGAFPMAMAFLDRLYGGNPRIGKLIHPDLHFIFPTAAGSISLQYMDLFRKLAADNPEFTEMQLSEALAIEGRNSMIAVSEARHLLDTLSLSALEGGYRSVVMLYPEKMNQEASNRLLKLIEEPPLMTQFVLITHAPEKVLQTISSRCQRIRINPSGKASDDCGFADTGLFEDFMDSLMSGNLLESIEAAEKVSAALSRENAKAFCRYAASRMRLIFLAQQGVTGLSEPSERITRWAAGCRKTFPRKALEALSRACQLIDRNVNQKIVFTDLVDRLYIEL